MLAEKFFRRRRSQQMLEFSPIPVKTSFHFFPKFIAKPPTQRRSESAFWAPANFRGDPRREGISKHCLADTSFKVITERQTGREIHQLWIQEGCAALQGGAHTRAIDLYHDLFGQIGRGRAFKHRERIV